MRLSPVFSGADLEPAYLPLLRLWILRALVHCNGAANFLSSRGFNDAVLPGFLGFSQANRDDYCPRKAGAKLRRLLGAAEKRGARLPVDTVIGRNLAGLQHKLGLTDRASEILHFVVLERLHAPLATALEHIGALTDAAAINVLALCLGKPVAAVYEAIDCRSKLARSAILGLDASRSYSFRMKVDLLEGLSEGLMLEQRDLTDLFVQCFTLSPAPRLALSDYPHLAQDAAILQGYLPGAGSADGQGVNVLVYGPPGTGKTEFVRALAAASNLRLFEIACEDSAGKPRSGKTRFVACRLAQSLLKGPGGCALLFDEVEDVFSDDKRPLDGGNASGIKGWVNALLETNPVPCFWVTNHLGAIDRAYRRRFDYVLRIDVPPRSVRQRLIERHPLTQSLDAPWREAAASHRFLAPAILERAARVTTEACLASPALEPAQVITRVMNNTFDALGVGRLSPGSQAAAPAYRLDLLNADCNLDSLCSGLRRQGEGRLCLYGPPGTGKTAFAHYLAEALDRPLLLRRVSDLLRPHVGQTEQNIAEMFREAWLEQAVLLLDEADSFLRDRRGARQAWELTQVNEMLTQMEAFQGIFIASTNLMDSLDEASLRRFDAKVRFGYLDAAQARAMFAALSGSLGLSDDPADADALALLRTASHLTPGDFASVARGARLHTLKTRRELAALLIQACQFKRKDSRAMGFTAALN